MANTKVTSRVLADDAVGLAQLNISNDPSNGQALTYFASTNDLQWATISGGASAINGLSDGTTSGTRNTGLGANALDDGSLSGTQNTAIGESAATANTSGTNVNAFGYSALGSNTTGSNNCAFGTEALGALTTGSNNIAIGKETGLATTGSDNTFVGNEAGRANTSGQRNVYIGIDAGRSGTTNSENCIVGRKAGYSNTASAITAIGTEALYNNTGSDNTALGAAALNSNSSGSYNTGLGRNAGSSMTTATYNTTVGYNAGQGSYPLTTGSSCTMVGALARPSGTLGNANGENVFGFNMSANGASTTTLGSGGSGLYASHGSNSWTSVSDERYKKDIVDSEVGLSFINDLRPRNFKWKTCGEVPSDTPRYEKDSGELINSNLTGVMHGFIAQEVKTVIDNHSEVPDNQLIWKEDPDGIQGLAEGELVPALVKAVQELSAKNDALETRIQELEG